MSKIIKTWNERVLEMTPTPKTQQMMLETVRAREAEITDLRAYIAELEARTPAATVAWVYWPDGADLNAAPHGVCDYEPMAYANRKPLGFITPAAPVVSPLVAGSPAEAVTILPNGVIDEISGAADVKPYRSVILDEAPKLARILFGLIEGGGVCEDINIYANDYQAGDGDVYVYRAAELLVELAAENRELVRYVDAFGTQLAERKNTDRASPRQPNWRLSKAEE